MMTEQEQRIAIAEFCGWTKIKFRSGMTAPDGYSGVPPAALQKRYSPRNPDHVMSDFSEGSPAKPIALLPDYLNDLNAMHEVRSFVRSNTELRVRYINCLRGIVGRRCEKNKSGAALVSDFDLLDAAAYEHAEALLRTIRKWVDK